jgi:lipoprotein-releasing system permease protein
MIGVAVGTLAMVIVLSAFNGFEDVLRALNRNVDPDLKISVKNTKYFSLPAENYREIMQLDAVKAVYEVIEDNALVMYDDGQLVVKVKGVSDHIADDEKYAMLMSTGRFQLSKGGISKAVVSIGIQQALGISLKNQFEAVQIWFPKPKNQLSANPAEAFTRLSLPVSGIIKLEESTVLVPLDFAQKLFKKDTLRTAYELSLTKGASIDKTKQAIKSILGAGYLVQDSDEQHESFYRVMALEKLFVFIALSFILIISSFNIFVSISMIGIEKQRDMFILQALGAPSTLIKQIFIYLGILLAFTGLAVGLILGVGIVWLQDTYGLVKLGMESTIIEFYPVKLLYTDLLLIAAVVVCITFLAVWHPARKAAMAGK